VNEIGPDGKSKGRVYFTNAEMFGRYLVLILKDASGPKELRIISKADTSKNSLISAEEACKAAGFRQIVVVDTESVIDTKNRGTSYPVLIDPMGAYSSLHSELAKNWLLDLDLEAKKELQLKQDEALKKLEEMLKQNNLTDQQREELRKLVERLSNNKAKNDTPKPDNGPKPEK
jgi:hypothetical protein